MVKGYIIRYSNVAKNHQQDFDGIYLDREEAENNLQQIITYARIEDHPEGYFYPIMCEFDFVDCSPGNQEFYIFQHKAIRRIMYGIFDDEQYFLGYLNEIKQNKINYRKNGNTANRNKEYLYNAEDIVFKILSDEYKTHNVSNRRGVAGIVSRGSLSLEDNERYNKFVFKIKNASENRIKENKLYLRNKKQSLRIIING